MKLRDFLASKAVTLCFWGIAVLLVCGLIAATGSGWKLVLLMAAGAALLIAAWLAVTFLLTRRRIARLDRLAGQLEEPYLLGELLPEPQDAVERQYFEIMKTVSRSAIGAVEDARQERESYGDYVEQWIHEIKTPLTACSLILANGGDPRKLRRELKRADNLTESILYYARLRTAEKDTVIREISVAAVIDEAIKSQMELLISAGIRVQTQGDFTVCTDDKAFCFILKQLLVNCAQYCPGCTVAITAADGAVTVADNGIGIPAHDLPRVTERGFTGTNGRTRGGSTGMGLYIVRELCERLNIELTIESEQGQYTRFRLAFASLTKA